MRPAEASRASLALACALLAGCGGIDGGGDAGQAPEPGIFEKGTLEEEWSVGGGDDRGGVVLSGVLKGIIQDHGEVLILDEMGVAVHRISPEGESLGSIDRRGRAPGELLGPRSVGTGAGGTFWVLDRELQRVTWFNEDGAVTATWRVPPDPLDTEGGSARPVAALAGGRVLAQDRPPVGRPAPTIPVVTGDSLGRWTLHQAVAGVRSPEPGVVTSQGIPIYFPRPASLEGDPIFIVRPGGETFSIVDRSAPPDGAAGRIRIHRFRYDGEAIGELAIPYTPVPVADSTRTAMRTIVERRLEILAQGNANLVLPTAEEGVEAMAVPRYLPPVRAAFEDEEGYWLVREAASDYVIERYSLEGDAVGRLQLPRGSGGLIGARRDQLLIARNDSLRVPLVTSYTVRWEAPGS